ncbi:hypothetical protein GCM10017673_25890 [Streptosporangium violaceochromogenes]|nr:hypothetical protein GCM10017673_25890 [Streptosporangium violaceochromogenes]
MLSLREELAEQRGAEDEAADDLPDHLWLADELEYAPATVGAQQKSDDGQKDVRDFSGLE